MRGRAVTDKRIKEWLFAHLTAAVSGDALLGLKTEKNGGADLNDSS